MEKKYKAKAKGSEMDALIKKVSAKVAPIVAARLNAQEQVEKMENEAAIKIYEAHKQDSKTTEVAFNATLFVWCASRNKKLCDRTGCTCRVGLCPIMKSACGWNWPTK